MYTVGLMRRFFLSAIGLGIAALVIVQFGSYTKKPISTRPLGPTTATGTLIGADVSLIRRGTHVLVVDGERAFYVESRTQNLQEFEGQTVTVEGNLAKNTVQDELYVLEATSVKRSHGDDDLKRWDIPAIGIHLNAPVAWTPSIQGSTANFMLLGETVPLLTIKLVSGSTLPPGTSMYISNRRTTRVDGEAEDTEVFILEKSSIISLQFSPSSQNQVTRPEEAQVLRAQFDRMLSDITFLIDKKLPSTQTGGTMGGTACGGTAGILCPAGFYCDINDPVNRIGQCKARK